MRRIPTLALASALAAAAPAWAATPPEVEAEQVNIFTGWLLGLNDSSEQRLAQSFRTYRWGLLSHVMVPVTCQPGTKVVVTIEKTDANGAPNGSVIASEVVPGYVFTSLPMPPSVGMRMVEFSSPPKLAPGRYAFTLTGKGSSCGVYPATDAKTYADGDGWFIAAPNPPTEWLELVGPDGKVRDLAFQVYLRPL